VGPARCGRFPHLPHLARRAPDAALPSRQVTSRVAEAFYWIGRYLERAQHQAYLISVVETLETEELNDAERRHYRPMWNRLLPPLEKSAGTSRRSITTRRDRYRLVLSPEPGSVATTFLRAMRNAESVQDSLSPEAWATLTNLRARFQRTRFRDDDLPENEAARTTRRLADFATQLIPQFFAVCGNTMLADDGWRFCEIGQMLERATITANSLVAIRESFKPPIDASSRAMQAIEIELSAFLRLLDAGTPTGASFKCEPSLPPFSSCSGSIPRCRAACTTACGDAAGCCGNPSIPR
jgi:uncharacterized alpha-E superfamily protein